MRLLSLAAGAAAAAFIASLTAAPSPAAPGSTPTPATMIIGGRTTAGANLDGAFAATDFRIDPAGQLVVNGMLSGVLTAPGTLPSSIRQPMTLPVDRQDSSTTCRMLNLAIGPDTTAGGVSLHLDQSELTIMQQQGPGSLLVVPFCDAARLLRGPDLDPAVLAPLNEIVHLVAGMPG